MPETILEKQTETAVSTAPGGERARKKPSLLYVYSAGRGDIGPERKCRMQVEALKTKYDTKLIEPLKWERTASLWEKLPLYVYSQLRFIYFSLKADVIYYRYNPFTPLYNLVLVLLSCFKRVKIEHNTVMLQVPGSPFHYALLDYLQLLALFLTRAHHLIANRDVQKAAGPARNAVDMPNGYSAPENNEASGAVMDKTVLEKLERVRQEKESGKKLLCLVCSHDFPWVGLPLVCGMVEKLENVFLVLIGNVKAALHIRKLEKQGKALRTGFVNASCLPAFYKWVDLGLGSFDMWKGGARHGSPLKVREYLCYGLPVIVNHSDPLLEKEWAKPFLCLVDWNGLTRVRKFIRKTHRRELLRRLARENLSWEAVFKRAKVL